MPPPVRPPAQHSPNGPHPPPRPTRFAPYTQALAAISQRTRTPLPSLVVSFAVLHELTALVPLAGFFFGAQALGVGDVVVQAVTTSPGTTNDGGAGREVNWIRLKGQQWIEEGEQWAEKVGRRYGVFGFEKRDTISGSNTNVHPLAQQRGQAGEMSSRLAGDAANAIVAYALTKAFLPVRVAMSLYLSPAFSRRVVEPVRHFVFRPFTRRS